MKKPTPKWASEAEMDRPLVRWLRFEGWDVFQEVVIQDSRADIVATRKDRLWIIETKLTLSLDLLAQADAWRLYTDWVSIGIPPAKKKRFRQSKGREFAYRLMKERGIGVIQIHPPRDNRGIEVREKLAPQQQPSNTAMRRFVSAQLVPQQRDYAEAGNADGLFWTPFQESCRKLRHFVEENPGITLYDAVKELGKLHYASENSARGALRKRIEEGVVRGIRGETSGRDLLLYTECIDKSPEK